MKRTPATLKPDQVDSVTPFPVFLQSFKANLANVFRVREDLDLLSISRGLPPYVLRDIMACSPLATFVPAEYGGRGGRPARRDRPGRSGVLRIAGAGPGVRHQLGAVHPAGRQVRPGRAPPGGADRFRAEPQDGRPDDHRAGLRQRRAAHADAPGPSRTAAATCRAPSTGPG